MGKEVSEEKVRWGDGLHFGGKRAGGGGGEGGEGERVVREICR